MTSAEFFSTEYFAAGSPNPTDTLLGQSFKSSAYTDVNSLVEYMIDLGSS